MHHVLSLHLLKMLQKHLEAHTDIETVFLQKAYEEKKNSYRSKERLGLQSFGDKNVIFINI